MGKKKIAKRVKSMKCFVKYYNVNHIMNTRYTVSGGSQGGSLEVKGIFKDALSLNKANAGTGDDTGTGKRSSRSLTLAQRTKLCKKVRTHFMERYQEDHEKEQLNLDFFFTKLRF